MGITSALVLAVAAQCSQVTLEPLPFSHTENFSVTFQELKRKFSDSIYIGVTTAKFQVIGDPATCTVKLGFTDVELYVASEVSENECAKKAVYTHELEHVRIFRESLQQFPMVVGGPYVTRLLERFENKVRNDQIYFDIVESKSAGDICDGWFTQFLAKSLTQPKN